MALNLRALKVDAFLTSSSSISALLFTWDSRRMESVRRWNGTTSVGRRAVASAFCGVPTLALVGLVWKRRGTAFWNSFTRSARLL